MSDRTKSKILSLLLGALLGILLVSCASVAYERVVTPPITVRVESQFAGSQIVTVRIFCGEAETKVFRQVTLGRPLEAELPAFKCSAQGVTPVVTGSSRTQVYWQGQRMLLVPGDVLIVVLGPTLNLSYSTVR